jgi:HEPN domain-containing protein
MDKSVIINEWLDYATKDINSAKYLLGMRPIPLEIICYHCEQAAEKILKCYLIHRDEEPPRTHDLKLLWIKPLTRSASLVSISHRMASNRGIRLKLRFLKSICKKQLLTPSMS